MTLWYCWSPLKHFKTGTTFLVLSEIQAKTHGLNLNGHLKDIFFAYSELNLLFSSGLWISESISGFQSLPLVWLQWIFQLTFSTCEVPSVQSMEPCTRGHITWNCQQWFGNREWNIFSCLWTECTQFWTAGSKLWDVANLSSSSFDGLSRCTQVHSHFERHLQCFSCPALKWNYGKNRQQISMRLSLNCRYLTHSNLLKPDFLYDQSGLSSPKMNDFHFYGLGKNKIIANPIFYTKHYHIHSHTMTPKFTHVLSLKRDEVNMIQCVYAIVIMVVSLYVNGRHEVYANEQWARCGRASAGGYDLLLALLTLCAINHNLPWFPVVFEFSCHLPLRDYRHNINWSWMYSEVYNHVEATCVYGKIDAHIWRHTKGTTANLVLLFQCVFPRVHFSWWCVYFGKRLEDCLQHCLWLI